MRRCTRALPDEFGGRMKFVEPHSFASPDVAARKLVEIANGVDAVQDGRIYIERVNVPFLAAGGSGEDFRAGIARAIAQGWLWRHEGGTYVRFTDAGAALFGSLIAPETQGSIAEAENRASQQARNQLAPAPRSPSRAGCESQRAALRARPS